MLRESAINERSLSNPMTQSDIYYQGTPPILLPVLARQYLEYYLSPSSKGGTYLAPPAVKQREHQGKEESEKTRKISGVSMSDIMGEKTMVAPSRGYVQWRRTRAVKNLDSKDKRE